MDRTPSDPDVLVQLALALTVAGALGLVLPSIISGVDGPSAVVVALLAMTVAAMVRVGSRLEPAPALVPLRVHVSDDD